MTKNSQPRFPAAAAALPYLFEASIIQRLIHTGLSDYVVPVQGRILTHDHSGTPSVEVGRISAQLVLVDRIANEDASVVDVFQQNGVALADAYAAFYDPKTRDLKPRIQRLFGDDLICRPNFLLLNSVEIVADHRRRRLGLGAVVRLIDLVSGGCGLVALNTGAPTADPGRGPGRRSVAGPHELRPVRPRREPRTDQARPPLGTPRLRAGLRHAVRRLGTRAAAPHAGGGAERTLTIDLRAPAQAACKPKPNIQEQDERRHDLSTIQIEDPTADVTDHDEEVKKFEPAAVEQFLDLLARMMARKHMRDKADIPGPTVQQEDVETP